MRSRTCPYLGCSGPILTVASSAVSEAGKVRWYALKLGVFKFGIFDTFADQKERDFHLGRVIAKALFARAEELFAKPPAIEQPEILAATG